VAHGAFLLLPLPAREEQTRRVGARTAAVGREISYYEVFGPSKHDVGVSFAKKWSQSRVSRVAALLH
jgi:hypothetical protein